MNNHLNQTKGKQIMAKFNPEDFRIPTTGDYAPGGKLHNVVTDTTPPPTPVAVVDVVDVDVAPVVPVVSVVKEGELVLIEYFCNNCGSPRGLSRAPVGMVISGSTGTKPMDLNPWEVKSCGFNPEEVKLYIYKTRNCCGHY